MIQDYVGAHHFKLEESYIKTVIYTLYVLCIMLYVLCIINMGWQRAFEPRDWSALLENQSRLFSTSALKLEVYHHIFFAPFHAF